jgi:tRNA (guanosine-2'-O-)-methyltransferase
MPTAEDVLLGFTHVPARDICAALSPFLVDGRRERIDRVVGARRVGLTIVIENLHDPHNGAAVLRSAEAFGLQDVHVVEASERFRFSTEVSQGCEKWVDLHRYPTFAEARGRLHAEGFALYAAVPGGPVNLHDLDFARPAAIVVGNERDGLTAGAMSACDVQFTIPMDGMTQSLNLSVAAAVVLAHAVQKRRAAGSPAHQELDAARGESLRARFYAASVRGAEAILARTFGHRGGGHLPG